jgi:ribosomal protein S18 acetylase RimI-like enzyme
MVMEKKTYILNDGREVNIRPLRPRDKDQLIHLLTDTSIEAAQNLLTLQQIEQKLQFPDYYISLVTEHDNKIFGYGEIQKDSQKQDGELTIHLHPDYQGVGLGTAMMIILLKDATEQQLQQINLQVANKNHAAIRLFRKFGFQQEEKTQTREHDTLYMTRILKKIIKAQPTRI